MPATRTLIVDDSELARRGIRAILSGSPLFDVVGEASDGRQGIARTRELMPDLVLMDLRMPGMSGLDAIGMIKEESPGHARHRTQRLGRSAGPLRSDSARRPRVSHQTRRGRPVARVSNGHHSGRRAYLARDCRPHPAGVHAPVSDLPSVAAHAHHARRGGARPGGARTGEQGDRHRAGDRRGHGEAAPAKYPRQAAAAKPGGTGDLRAYPGSEAA